MAQDPKSGLRFFICTPKVPSLSASKLALLSKVPFFWVKKRHFGYPNKNFEANFEKWKILQKEVKKSQTPLKKGPHRFQNVFWHPWGSPNQNTTGTKTFEIFRIFCHTIKISDMYIVHYRI